MSNKRRIKLMNDYIVFIEDLAKLSDSGNSPYSHLAKIPKKELEGIDRIPCEVFYPLDENYVVEIKIDKLEEGNYFWIRVDNILMALSQAYRELEGRGCLKNHALSDLYIEELELVDGHLVVYVGS